MSIELNTNIQLEIILSFLNNKLTYSFSSSKTKNYA